MIVIPLTESEYLTVMVIAASAWSGPECDGVRWAHPSDRIATLALYLSSRRLTIH